MKRTHSVGIMFSISLIFLFTMLSALIIYMGYNGYKNITDNREYNNDCRVTLSYLTGKVKTADSVDGVSISEREGYEVLSVSDGDCETLIYYYKNSIYEAYMSKGDEFEPAMGERIAKVKGYKAEKTADKISFEITLDDDEKISAIVAIRK